MNFYFGPLHIYWYIRYRKEGKKKEGRKGKRERERKERRKGGKEEGEERQKEERRKGGRKERPLLSSHTVFCHLYLYKFLLYLWCF